MEEVNNNILTDEQIEKINSDLEEFRQTEPMLKVLADMPSNNGIEVNENPEQGEYKAAMMKIDPNTGEQIIVGAVNEDDFKEPKSFDEICDSIDNIIDEKIEAPYTFDEVNDYIQNSKSDSNSMFKEIFGDEENIDDEIVMSLLNIANRKLNKEEFNVYKALPDKIKALINKYLNVSENNNANQVKMFRNTFAESLIDEFATSISMNRIQDDLNKEIETLYTQGSGEIADSIIGYTTERNQEFRKMAESIEDPEKKETMINILDKIDEAYNLSELKEFCKKCKIKHIELEKCTEKSYVINQFLAKYDDSQYNIYSLYTAEQALLRNLNRKGYECTQKEVRAFTIAFCTQCKNYTPNDSLQHAYMYYVVYNIVLADINTGDKKEVSDKFLDNVIECIENLKVRNNNFK